MRRIKFTMNKNADLPVSGTLAFEVPIAPFPRTSGIADFTDRDAREERRKLSKDFWQDRVLHLERSRTPTLAARAAGAVLCPPLCGGVFHRQFGEIRTIATPCGGTGTAVIAPVLCRSVCAHRSRTV